MIPSMLTEAKVLMLLRGLPHVQQLVGVCPEQRSLVTKYGGPTLREHLETLSLSTKQKA